MSSALPWRKQGKRPPYTGDIMSPWEKIGFISGGVPFWEVLKGGGDPILE